MAGNQGSKTQVHSVFDSESLAKQAVGEILDRTEQETVDLIRQLKDSARKISVMNMSDFEHQCGHMMPWWVLEERIKTMVPTGLYFGENTLTPQQCEFLGFQALDVVKVRVIEKVLPNGTKEYVASYLMLDKVPEYTIILTQPRYLPTPRTNFNAKDFPEFETRLVNGVAKRMPKGPVPTLEVIEEEAGQLPGWRTVLLQLITARVTTPTEVGKYFGESDRATWAQKLGKKDIRDLPV